MLSFDRQDREETNSYDYYGNMRIVEEHPIEARQCHFETTVSIFRFPCLPFLTFCKEMGKTMGAPSRIVMVKRLE